MDVRGGAQALNDLQAEAGKGGPETSAGTWNPGRSEAHARQRRAVLGTGRRFASLRASLTASRVQMGRRGAHHPGGATKHPKVVELSRKIDARRTSLGIRRQSLSTKGAAGTKLTRGRDPRKRATRAAHPRREATRLAGSGGGAAGMRRPPKLVWELQFGQTSTRRHSMGYDRFHVCLFGTNYNDREPDQPRPDPPPKTDKPHKLKWLQSPWHVQPGSGPFRQRRRATELFEIRR